MQFVKFIFLSLSVTIFFSQCNAHSLNFSGNKISSNKLQDDTVERFTVKQEDVDDDYRAKRRSCCKIGKVGYGCWPKTCPLLKSYAIHFNEYFRKVPKVMVAISGLDVSKNYNNRVIVQATGKTKAMFTLKIKTWADTKLYLVNVNWIACGSC